MVTHRCCAMDFLQTRVVAPSTTTQPRLITPRLASDNTAFAPGPPCRSRSQSDPALGSGTHLVPVSLSQFPHLSLTLPLAIEGVPVWVCLGFPREPALAVSQQPPPLLRLPLMPLCPGAADARLGHFRREICQAFQGVHFVVNIP